MKKTLTAVLAGLVVFATIYGFAASLTLSSSSLGAGSAAVAACQAGAIGTSYTPSYQTSIPGYEATTVTLTNLDETAPGCGGQAVRVTLTDVSDASLGEQTATLPTGAGTTEAFTFSGVAASDVAGVHVVISS
jgi:hypothetical protein